MVFMVMNFEVKEIFIYLIIWQIILVISPLSQTGIETKFKTMNKMPY